MLRVMHRLKYKVSASVVSSVDHELGAALRLPPHPAPSRAAGCAGVPLSVVRGTSARRGPLRLGNLPTVCPGSQTECPNSWGAFLSIPGCGRNKYTGHQPAVPTLSHMGQPGAPRCLQRRPAVQGAGRRLGAQWFIPQARGCCRTLLSGRV